MHHASLDLITDLGDDAVFDDPSQFDVVATTVVAMLGHMCGPFRYPDADRMFVMMNEGLGPQTSASNFGSGFGSAGMNFLEKTSKITTEVDMAISATLKMNGNTGTSPISSVKWMKSVT